MLRSFASDRPDLTAFLFALPLAVLLLVSGCDPTVDLIDPSEQYRYSLYGVLDVAADTQVIRVDPLGSPSEVGVTSAIDARVVLRNLSSGEEIPLRDSLTTIGASTQMQNVWTTHPIQPGTPYRISVMKGDTALTTATTTTPAQPPDLEIGQPIYLPCTFPTPINPNRESENTFVVLAKNVHQVAAATIQYPIIQPLDEDTLHTWFSRDHFNHVTEVNNRFNVSVFYRSELVSIHPDPPSGSPECPTDSNFFRPAARMIVAAGGPQWPEWQNASLDDLARPDTFSNVQGGHGFVGGVYSDTIRVPFADRLP